MKAAEGPQPAQSHLQQCTAAPSATENVFVLKGPRHSAELGGLKASAMRPLCKGLAEPSVLLHFVEALTLMPKSSYGP